LKIAFWSPLPPAPSEIADHTTELLPALAQHHEVLAVVEDPTLVDPTAIPGVSLVASRSAPEADLDVYAIGTPREHVFAYQAALRRPGVVLLHEWILHDLVWREAAEQDDVYRYLQEMRASHGESGTFVGRQVIFGRGGSVLPRLFAVNDRLLESSLGAATLTREAEVRLKHRHPRIPRLHLPPHLALPEAPLPSRDEARRSLGLPRDGLLVTAPGRATGSVQLEALIHAIGRVRAELPSLCLVVAGDTEPGLPWETWASAAGLGEALVITGRLSREDLLRHLIAADVVSALRFPSRGEMPAQLVRALGLGRPVLVTAGTPGAEEMPQGVVVPIDPGPREGEELVALLRELLTSERLRETIGAAAQAQASAHHRLEGVAADLSAFLVEVRDRRRELLRDMTDWAKEGTLAAYLAGEVRRPARDLGLELQRLALQPLLAPLAAPPRSPEDQG
jgi:glycosyltransferase involved in cell wall biosynthesis